MIDIKLVRENREAIERKLKTKDPTIDLTLLCEYDTRLRELLTQVETLKHKKNSTSKAIGELKRLGKDASDALEEVSAFNEDIKTLDEQVRQTRELFEAEISALPNIPFDHAKISHDPAENVCIKTWGEKPKFNFQPKSHVELNEKLGLFDFVRGAKISGSGWVVYSNLGARLEWALINYMYETNLKNGFTPMMVPHCVRPEIMYGSGQLPKFASQLFKIQDEDYQLYLIPTAEIALNGLHADEILPSSELPKMYMSYTPCFRREAGAAGKKEQGLIRVHQFNKVELFCFTRQDESASIFEKMITSAETILQGLGLHYRLAELVTGDMSFGSSYTVDIEAYLSEQGIYKEVSSVSNCTDYQSRRSNIRYRDQEGNLHLAHTLNGSSLATSRLMVAILESNQQEDGSIKLPKVLADRLDFDTLTPTK